MNPVPEKALASGVQTLNEVLGLYGFEYRSLGTVNGSGGAAAAGEFRKGNRGLELHFRYSLGLVTYHLDSTQQESITHDDYMWSVIGKAFASKYPDFSDDPLEAFRALRSDLEEYGRDFLDGSDSEFLRHIQRAAELKNKRGKLP
jgi:hypothetical protein